MTVDIVRFATYNININKNKEVLKMSKVTEKNIKEANRLGLADVGTENYQAFYTAILQVAYDHGRNGRDLTNAPSSYRI